MAQRLVDATFADQVFFTNSGVEAIECAIKTARRHFFAAGTPQRHRLITFEGAFHGRTLTAISAAQNPVHTEGFAPLVPGFDQVPIGDIDKVRAAVTDETAGILIEPIQGEGGIRPMPNAFLRALRDLCDERGLLLLFDEVQTGLGRTGKLFAYEWSGIAPDIMAIAKGLGSGFPVGACLATAEAADAMTAGTHGSTFGGNPLAMAVGNGVLDVVLADGFLDHVQETGSHLLQGLAMTADKFPRVIDCARGQGLMIGVKCRASNADLLKAMVEEKLLAAKASDNVVRLVPPLIIGQAEIRDGLERFERACARVDDAL